jgi:hypothetical protein
MNMSKRSNKKKSLKEFERRMEELVDEQMRSHIKLPWRLEIPGPQGEGPSSVTEAIGQFAAISTPAETDAGEADVHIGITLWIPPENEEDIRLMIELAELSGAGDPPPLPGTRLGDAFYRFNHPDREQQDRFMAGIKGRIESRKLAQQHQPQR